MSEEAQQQEQPKESQQAAAGRVSGEARRARKAARGGALSWTTPEEIHASLAKVADRLAAGEITPKEADSFQKLANGMLASIRLSYTERLEELEQKHDEQRTQTSETGVKRRNR